MMFGLIKMISCKEATYLSSKKEDSRITWRENLRLIMHKRMCALCDVFEKQSKFIGFHARKLEAHNQSAELPGTVKSKVHTVISEGK